MMFNFLNTKTIWFSATFITGAMLGFGSTKARANGVSEYTEKLSGELVFIPDLVGWLCTLGGISLSALGLVSLKQHVEMGGQQKPMKDGLAKLGFGGMLMAIYPLMGALQESANVPGGVAQFNPSGFTSPRF